MAAPAARWKTLGDGRWIMQHRAQLRGIMQRGARLSLVTLADLFLSFPLFLPLLQSTASQNFDCCWLCRDYLEADGETRMQMVLCDGICQRSFHPK
jgi:hypothetical protein